MTRTPSPTPPELITGYGPGDLLISELLAAPGEAFDGEWVELLNPGLEPIPLAGWRIDDGADGGAHMIPDDQIIAGGTTLLIQLGRAIFNNSGDTVRLLAPDGLLVDSFAYEGARADQSFSRDPLGGRWSLGAPSPGLANPPAAAPAPPPAAAPAREPVSPPPAEPEPVEPPAAGPDASPQPAAPAPPLTLAAEAITAAPAYQAATPGEPYRYLTPAPPPAGPAPPAAPPDPGQPAPAAGLSNLALPGGLGLIVIALALFVAERTPASPEEDDQGVL